MFVYITNIINRLKRKNQSFNLRENDRLWTKVIRIKKVLYKADRTIESKLIWYKFVFK